MPSLQIERIESVKAGIISACFFLFAHLLLLEINTYILASQGEQWSYLHEPWWIDFLVEGGIAGISGFLFGVTYRYIIRRDRNSHLNDGAVLAFGLVRGLALIEKNTLIWSGSIILVESIICFAIARLSLDLALKYKLLKPF